MRAWGPLIVGAVCCVFLGSAILLKLHFDNEVMKAYHLGLSEGEKNAVSPEEQEARCLALWGLSTYKEQLHKGMY